MNNQPLEKIADIVVPLNPQPMADYTFIIILFFFVCIVAYGFFYLNKRQKFKRLKKQFYTKKINQRQFSIQLVNFLKKNNFDINQHAVKDKLEMARFSRHGLSDQEIQSLIINIEKWI